MLQGAVQLSASSSAASLLMINLINASDSTIINESCSVSHQESCSRASCNQVHTPHSQSVFNPTSLPQITFVDNKQLSELLENAIHQEQESSNYPSTSHISYELIMESQSGLTLFGINFFSSLFIPAKFQSINEKNYSNLKTIPFDDLNSSWIWKSWYIVMLNDVDDKGWCYSYKLNAKNWSGKFRFRGLRFFRRRLWMRLKLVNDQVTPDPMDELMVSDVQSSIAGAL
ncbi:hypothetical protein WICPIJ_001627 [Wickerhamomyces pijperi]|uniref:Peroxin/Ferlin domain-containing protein n=1 Tax=Wickerhamomyces pijperi TaxID=599730 RepID=A0A9P8TQI6_WICPI|nr:hypothetical protein WICPIJ_001627 [Wickerhamomyces pijperi]